MTITMEKAIPVHAENKKADRPSVSCSLSRPDGTIAPGRKLPGFCMLFWEGIVCNRKAMHASPVETDSGIWMFLPKMHISPYNVIDMELSE